MIFTKYVFAKKKKKNLQSVIYVFFYNTSEIYKNKMVQERLLETCQQNQIFKRKEASQWES